LAVPFKLLHHLTADEVMAQISSVERSAWRKIEMIRKQTQISSVLDKILWEHEEESVRNNNHGDKAA